MYGKIFKTMYEGTLYGQWQALVTMQQLIVLCDADGVVDMTPPAIAARTSIPLEIIEEGLRVLSEPDPYSRTPGEEGRRIALMDDHRPWGWIIVNHAKYRDMADAEKVREQTRERVRKHRKRREGTEACNAPESIVTVGNASNGIQTHTQDTDTKEIEEGASKTGNVKKPRFKPPTLDEVTAYSLELSSTVNPEKFLDHYASNGWKIGKASMKDWKATYRNWTRRDRENGHGEAPVEWT